MTLIESLFAQGVRALKDPRGAAADVIALGFPREALVPALFLVVAVSVILNSVSEILAPNPLLQISPFQMAMVLMVMLVAFAFAVARAGRLLGGLGTFHDSLLLMIFLQALFIPAVIVQMVLFALSPGLSGLFFLGVVIFLTWVHINFIAALHGFGTLGRAVGVLVMAMIATFLVLAVVAPFFVTPPGATDV